MFRKTLVIGLGMILGMGLVAKAEEKEILALELVKEMRFKEGIANDVGMVQMGVITSEAEAGKVRTLAGLSADEPVFPIRALRVGDKIKIFDAKGKIEKEIEGGGLISPNGECIVGGSGVIDRKGKTLWKNKDLSGWVVGISNKGGLVTTQWAKRGLKGLDFYDSSGRVTKKVDIEMSQYPMRFLSPDPMFQFSDNGETFACWDDGELAVFSGEGEQLFGYKIERARDFDKLKVSPDGRYIVVSCKTGGTQTVYPKDYENRLKQLKEALKQLEEDLNRNAPVIMKEEDWEQEKVRLERYKQEKARLKKEIKDLTKEVYLGPIKQSVFFFTKEGELMGSYDVFPGELAISFSPEGDYVGVGDYHNVYLFESTGKLVWNWKNEDSTIACDGEISLSSEAEYILVNFRIVKIPSNYPEYAPPITYIFDKSGEILLTKYLKGISPIQITSDGKQVIGIRCYKDRPRDGNYGILYFKIK